MGHFGKAFLHAGFPEAVSDPLFVILHAGGHALAQLEGKEVEILKDHGKQVEIFPVIIFLNVDAV